MDQSGIQFHDLHTDSIGEDFEQEIRAALRKKPRTIPPKYFYDQRGSQLFDAITQTPEYYPTRTEIAILKEHANTIAEQIGTGHLLVEPGGGSCSKVRILLDGLEPCAYVPMDISRDHLKIAAEQMACDFPWLEVHAACIDFTQKMTLPDVIPGGTRVAFFPGSSIGNFKPENAIEFLRNIAELVSPRGYLLIGVDLKKDVAVLNAAYNDAQGFTAEFNRNLLERINRELQADFNLSQWEHKAFYNESQGRIEMHLKSLCDQQVSISGESFVFDEGETIHTENSYKYGISEFQSLARNAGLVPVSVWTDEQNLFSVHLLQADLLRV